MLSARALLLQLRWYDVGNAEWLDFTVGNGTLEGAALLIDPNYMRPQLAQVMDVQFGDLLKLVSYDIDPTEASASDVIRLDLAWDIQAQPETDTVLTVQLYDAEGQFISQWDGPLAGLPYWLWRDNLSVIDSRDIALPEELPAGEYELRLGWYNLDMLTRLPVENASQQDNLAILETPLTIRP